MGADFWNNVENEAVLAWLRKTRFDISAKLRKAFAKLRNISLCREISFHKIVLKFPETFSKFREIS
jgi:hypothetical protein